jgi:hypothetical protein
MRCAIVCFSKLTAPPHHTAATPPPPRTNPGRSMYTPVRPGPAPPADSRTPQTGAVPGDSSPARTSTRSNILAPEQNGHVPEGFDPRARPRPDTHPHHRAVPPALRTTRPIQDSDPPRQDRHNIGVSLCQPGDSKIGSPSAGQRRPSPRGSTTAEHGQHQLLALYHRSDLVLDRLIRSHVAVPARLIPVAPTRWSANATSRARPGV